VGESGVGSYWSIYVTNNKFSVIREINFYEERFKHSIREDGLILKHPDGSPTPAALKDGLDSMGNVTFLDDL